MALEYVPPHTFKDGVEETASGVQVMDDLFAVFNQLVNQFLKLATAEDLKLKMGSFSTPGFDSVAGRSSSETEVAHGLGKTPRIVLVSSEPIHIQEDGGIGLYAVTASPMLLTGTTFKVKRTAHGTTNNGCTCYWAAIG